MIELMQRMNKIRNDGHVGIRIYHKKKQGKQSARYLLKCGCCDKSLEIFYGDEDDTIEINGVVGSKKNWLEILSPILEDAKSNTWNITKSRSNKRRTLFTSIKTS